MKSVSVQKVARVLNLLVWIALICNLAVLPAVPGLVYFRFSSENYITLSGLQGTFAYDFDDGHRFSTVHLGSAVIPPVLAVAEKEGLSMEDAIRGIVIGYEAGIRLGRCIQPSHRGRGFHSSGTVGAIAAAMGVAALLDFDRDQFKATLAAACSAAGGINEMMENVSTMKPFLVRVTAVTGAPALVSTPAASMAKRSTSSTEFAESDRGYILPPSPSTVSKPRLPNNSSVSCTFNASSAGRTNAGFCP